MAKKKAAKTAKKTKKPAKAPKKAAKTASKRTKAKTTKRAPAAGTVETVKPPMVDVTEEVKQTVVEVPPPAPAPTTATETTLPPATSVQMHEEFTKELTQEPPKKGFWARLFGKK